MVMFRATKSGPVELTAQEESERLAEQAAATAENDRIVELETTVRNDTVVNQLKSMTNAEFDSWWAANVTNAAQAINILKRLVKLILRRL